MNLMKDDDFQQYLEENGWVIECESPLEIRHNDGSFATLYAAKVLLGELQEQYKDEKGIVNDNDDAVPHQKTFEKLQKLFNAMDQYVQVAFAQEQEDRDSKSELVSDDGLSSEAYALWEKTYSLVFNKNLSHQIRDCLDELKIDMEYYDPDTSYKEDVLAYYNAVKSEIETLNKLINPSTSRMRI